MKTTLSKLSLAGAWLLSTFALHPVSLRAQGSLTPSGAPAPAMKTLAQIEARTPVDATNTPGIFNAQFTITQPGSYYLTGNITGLSTQAGIFIETNDVTLDLNGFVMTGAGPNYPGINVSSFGVQNIVIRNGTLRDWGAGVNAANGYCELEHVRVFGSSSGGFNLGNFCTVKNCTASGNLGAGITVGNGCVVTDCLVSSNGDSGISGGSDCVVSGCLAYNNNYDNPSPLPGIYLGDRFNVSKCTANSNLDTGFELGNSGLIYECVAETNGYFGIEIGNGCTVKECVANGNAAGISANGDNVLEDNHASFNNYEGIVTGKPGAGNRVENNHMSYNGTYGLLSSGGAGADVVIRNTSSNNATGNYDPTNGATFAPVQTPAGATSPFANF